MNQTISFGSFVRQRRREMDLTQEELARRVGCAAITLRKIEADDLRPSVQIAERLAMALAIPLDDRAEFVRRARAVHPESSDLPAITPAPSLDEIGHEDLTGRAIRGYALAERIGMGGMGSVYRAVQPNVEREVAVKIILPAFANHPDFIRRFEAEAQLVARLEHPHIVPLYDYWREPGVAYLVMRLLRGGNVQGLLGQGPLSLDVTTHLLEQICSALNAAHRIGVIHRDLKPANVLLDDDQNAYLADFGIAKNISDPDLEHKTQIDEIVGTPHYMSPEQIRSLSIKPQTDIYCLGIMLYEMLTGALPFAGPTPIDFIQQHINVPMPPLAAHHTGLPAALDAVIGRATAKNPEDRYDDALTLFKDFRQATSGLLNDRPTIIPVEDETDLEIINPFKGLRAFSEADAENFFGRETLVQQLLARLGEGGDLSRFLAVIGPSGSGKSSVVRAGLIPALRRGGLPGSENWFIVDMLPGKHPFEELEASLLRVAVNPPEHLLSQMKDGNRGLLRAVHRILPADATVELVLVIDQFEEVFTLIEDEAERALLLENLAAAVLDERSRLRVVITLRADFTDKPLRYVDFGELMNRRFEFILPLTADELERAILSPAQRVGLKLEKGLVSNIIREVGNQPGALPLLQYALSELFDKREGRTLTNKAYQEIGGVLGALGRSAETIYLNMDEISQSATRQLFLRLVTLGEGTEDTRRRVLRDELENLTVDRGQQTMVYYPLSTVVDIFGKARLLSFDRDPITRGPTIEVAHEALLREWTRLREWLNESRADVRTQRQLNTAAQEWNAAQRDAGFLMAGSRLEQFEGWSSNTTIALTQDEHAFLSASIAERDRRELEEQARQRRELEAAQKLAETEKQSVSRLRGRNRIITTMGSIAVILAIVAGMFGLQSNQNASVAQNNAATAQVAKNNAVNSQATAQAASTQAIADFNQSEAQRLAAEANSLRLSDGDPNLIALLTIQSLNMQYTASGDAVLSSLTTLPAPPRELKGHTGEVWGIDVSPDGKYLATTGSTDKTVRLWDFATGETVRVFSGHTAEVSCVVFSPDGKYLLTGSYDRTARLWDVASGQTVQVFTGQINNIENVAFSPDGRNIVTAGADEARVWDVGTGKTLHILSVNGKFLFFRVAYSPDGKYILTAIADKTARLWDAATGEQVHVFNHPDAVDGAAFSPDGKTIATSSEDHKARLWDLTTGQIIREFVGHQDGFDDTRFSPDGQFLLTGSVDHTARLWDVATGKTLRVFGGMATQVQSAVFSPDGNFVVTNNRNDVLIWSLQSSPGGMVFIGHNKPVRKASFSPDGRRVVTASDDGTARIWDAASGQTLMILKGHTAGLDDAVFSPDGKTVLTVSADKTARLWDVATGKELRRFEGHTNELTKGIFSPDGKYIVTTSYDGTARVWETQTGKTIVVYSNQGPGELIRAAYSPDGKTVATSGADHTARIWDPLTGKDLMIFKGHTDKVTGVAFSPDGKNLLTASWDGTVRLWDIASGKEIRQFKGHTSTVYGAAFSPDGNYVLTGGADRTARLWDVQTGQELRRFTGHADDVRYVSFSPDGKYILTASQDGTARLWLTSLDDTVRAVCSLLTRDLTSEERTQFGISDQGPTCPSQ